VPSPRNCKCNREETVALTDSLKNRQFEKKFRSVFYELDCQSVYWTWCDLTKFFSHELLALNFVIPSFLDASIANIFTASSSRGITQRFILFCRMKADPPRRRGSENVRYGGIEEARNDEILKQAVRGWKISSNSHSRPIYGYGNRVRKHRPNFFSNWRFFMNRLVQQFPPDCIYNCVEMALLFSALPVTTSMRQQEYGNSEMSSVLLCSNYFGARLEPVFVVSIYGRICQPCLARSPNFHRNLMQRYSIFACDA